MGPLCLNHSEFFRSTPAEILDLFEGYQWRNEQEWIKNAWLAANIMNASGHLKKPADPMKMLKGIVKQEEKPSLSRADQLSELAQIKEDIRNGQNND